MAAAVPLYGAKVLYVDQSSGFFVVAKTSYAQGENICLLNSAHGLFICPAVVSKQGKYDAIFVPKRQLPSVAEGLEFKVYQSYVKKDRFLAAQFEDSEPFVEGHRVADKIQVLGRIAQQQQALDAERENDASSIRIVGDLAASLSPLDYQPESLPEVFIPKMKRSRRRKSQEPLETDNIDKKISSLMGKTKLKAFSFTNPTKLPKKLPAGQRLVQAAAQEEAELQYAYIASKPSLHEIVLGMQMIQSVRTPVQYNGLAFNTIAVADRDPSTLWKVRGSEYKGYGGIALQMRILKSATHEMNIGFRAFEFRPYLQKTNFDLTAAQYAAHVRTNMSSNGFWFTRGLCLQVTDHLLWGYEGGVDIDQSNLFFTGRRVDTQAGEEVLFASLKSVARVFSLRAGLFTRYIVRSTGISLGANIQLPVYAQREVAGAVNLPEGISFAQDPVVDLKERLGHDKSSLGVEVIAAFGVPL